MPEFNTETLKVLSNHVEGTNYLFELFGHGLTFVTRFWMKQKKKISTLKSFKTL